MATPRPRILVVEDEAAIQRGLCDVLAYRGYEPVAAASGDEGLRIGLEGGFDLVVLDVMLPGRSGFEVCRRLRATPRRGRWRSCRCRGCTSTAATGRTAWREAPTPT